MIWAALSLPSAAAAATSRVDIVVPAGRLAPAIASLGLQAGITIGLTDPTLAAVPVRGIRGRMTAAVAVARLLAGTAATATAVDDATFRIVRRRAPTAMPDRPTSAAPQDIVVTASKRAAPLATYVGSVEQVDIGALPLGEPGRGVTALVDRMPVLASTHLGPGRNKLFVRGIADSSFNGPTQSTVGEYLGDVRLNYNAPDPGLALYDIRSAEVLEGPQGTLYGAGALGGVLRLTPAPPDLNRAGGSLSATGTATRGGAPGADGAAVVNLPLAPGRLALRGVAYVRSDGGYIDDPSRNAHDINRTRLAGGRATARYTPAGDWTIDLGGIVQTIRTRDGEYAQRGLPSLERASVIAQPFDNDYRLASLVVRHQGNATEFVSSTSAVFHNVASVYDASAAYGAPTRYRDRNAIMLLSNETRLSRHRRGGTGWVLGIQLLHSRSRIFRQLEADGDPFSADTRNVTDEASVYGEGTFGLTSRLHLTAGGRLAYDRLYGRVIGDPLPMAELRRHAVSALPSVGLSWQSSRRLAIYTRYQEGYRPGGLSIEAGRSQRVEADSVATWEAGVRYGGEADRFGLSAAVSHARWENIQADLIETSGLPYTANVGLGEVATIEARAHWRPTRGLLFDAALVATDSRLTRPTGPFAADRDASLPNIADLTAQIGGRYDLALWGRTVTVGGTLRYVGRSRLGVGPALDRPQGRYIDSSAALSVPVGRMVLSCEVDNILNTRGNIFALGNPFGLDARNQVTPLRPRTIRLGANVVF